MKHEELTMVDLLIETHVELKRQGPGSDEMTLKALSFLGDLDAVSSVVDMGCGTGSQTIQLAEQIRGRVIGLDQFSAFIDVLNAQAKGMNLEDKVKGIVGSMDDLPFEPEQFDLIWSEGAIDSIGFEKGLSYWHSFLKEGGHVAVTSPSWFSSKRPEEVERFWIDAGSCLDSIEDNIAILQKCGYSFVAAFALPESCWINDYFAPRDVVEEKLMKKYAGSKTLDDYIAGSRQEIELYLKYRQYYGYAFYIGKKM